jgi:O-antigen/teichoic acid export membrane protein
MFRSAAEVGLYAVALRLQPLLTLPTYALGETFNPVVAELFSREERGALQAVYRSTVRWSLLLTFPLVLPLLMVPEAVLRLFGAEFAAAAPVLRWVSVGTWLGAALGIAGYVLNMAGKPQVNLLNGILTAVLNLGLFFWLIPHFGMLGAAWTYAGVNVGIALLRMGQVWWLFRLHPWDATLGKAFLVVAAALSGGVLSASLSSGWGGTLVGLGIFGVLLPVAVSRDDRELWVQWRKRRES